MVVSGDGALMSSTPPAKASGQGSCLWAEESPLLQRHQGECPPAAQMLRGHCLSHLGCPGNHTSQHQGLGLCDRARGDCQRGTRSSWAGPTCSKTPMTRRPESLQPRPRTPTVHTNSGPIPSGAQMSGSHPTQGHTTGLGSLGTSLGIRGLAMPSALQNLFFFFFSFWSKTKVQIPLQSGNQFLLQCFPLGVS